MRDRYMRGSAAWRHEMRAYQRARFKQTLTACLILLSGLALLGAVMLVFGKS